MSVGIKTLGGAGELSSEKVDKQAIEQRALDPNLKIDGEAPRDLVSKIKWTLDVLSKGEEQYNREATMAQIDGLVRGFVAERLSNLVPLGSGDYVSPVATPSLKDLLDRSVLIAPADLEQPTMGIRRQSRDSRDPNYWSKPSLNPGWDKGRGKKAPLLQGVEADTMNVPGVIFDRDMDYSDLGGNITNREIRDRYMAEVIEGFGGSKGIHYNETTIPDGFLVYRDGGGEHVYGCCEVKAYTPIEFHLYVEKAVETRELGVTIADETHNGASGEDLHHYGGKMNLGFNIEGEQRFVDMLIDAQLARKNATSKDKQMASEPDGPLVPVVMRVLKDVDSADAAKLQELAQELGYPNFVIQKLPFSSEDMARLVPVTLRAVGPELFSRTDFSDREKEVLKELI